VRILVLSLSGVCGKLRCVAGRDVLDGVGDVPWGDLRHAYGAAGDVPALLRALGSGRGEAEEAVEGLFGSLCHQGTVYSVTPYAVLFLARIAAAGDLGSLVLGLLGCIAASEDECGLEVPGSARAAVTGQIGVLAPLLSDPDDEVRAAAVWALAQCGVPDRLVPLLRGRWDGEGQPAVRAAVLKGLSVLDPGVAAGAAAGAAARPGDAGLRLIAAVACAAARVPWSGQLHEAATAWMAEGDVLPGFWGGGDPFSELAVMLAAQGYPAAAVRLVGAGLAGPVAPGVRKRVVWCAGELAAAYRSPAPALAAPLAAVAGDDDAGRPAISLLRRLGDASRAVADQIAVIADVRGPDRRADEALAWLIDLGDPRAARLLGRDLPCRPIALHAAAAPTGRALPSPFPFEPILLQAIRDRLPAPGLAGNELIYLLSLLRGWGRAARPAIPNECQGPRGQAPSAASANGSPMPTKRPGAPGRRISVSSSSAHSVAPAATPM
jgi:HEAT repeat protein